MSFNYSSGSCGWVVHPDKNGHQKIFDQFCTIWTKSTQKNEEALCSLQLLPVISITDENEWIEINGFRSPEVVDAGKRRPVMQLLGQQKNHPKTRTLFFQFSQRMWARTKTLHLKAPSRSLSTLANNNFSTGTPLSLIPGTQVWHGPVTRLLGRFKKSFSLFKGQWRHFVSLQYRL